MSSEPTVFNPNNHKVTLTPAAISHVQNQIKKAGSHIGMRFGIRKSGCSGFAYDVKLIDEIQEDDKIFQITSDLLVAVAKKHLPVLQGTCIDYIKDGINYRFDFKNPNETASCGCGESFTVAGENNTNI